MNKSRQDILLNDRFYYLTDRKLVKVEALNEQTASMTFENGNQIIVPINVIEIRDEHREPCSGEIRELTKKGAEKLFQTREPAGLFIVQHSDQGYIGIDNTTGDAWVKIGSLVDVKKWLVIPKKYQGEFYSEPGYREMILKGVLPPRVGEKPKVWIEKPQNTEKPQSSMMKYLSWGIPVLVSMVTTLIVVGLLR